MVPWPCSSASRSRPTHLAKAVSGLAQRDNVREAVILSTCNRTEVYVVAELFHGAYGDVRDLLCELGDLGVDELTPHLYSQHDTAAVTHLFEVAAGLDSAVLGESEILGQVRTAWDVAQREGGISFDAQPAVPQRPGDRQTRPQRNRHRPRHGVDQPCRRRDDLRRRGRAVRPACAGGRRRFDGRRVSPSPCVERVAPRSSSPTERSERGSALADRVDGVAVGFDRLPEAVAAADVIIVGTGSDQAVLTHSLVADARSGRASNRPLHIVDIGVPRNVDPSVADLAGVTLSDLDDLRDWADRGLSHRAAEAEHVRVIVSEEVERFLVESTARQAAPLVASMHGAAEQVRAAELERFAARFADLDDSQRDAVEVAHTAIVAKLLHEPSVRLKAQAGTPQGERNAAAMRDLFDLG